LKTAVISDIHSNLKALKLALNMIDKEFVNNIFICGDIVGYGDYPNECCDLIRSLSNCTIIAGNHDRAVSGLANYDTYSSRAVKGIEYTKGIIRDDNLEWLKDLPLYVKYDDMEFVHGSLVHPEEFYYLINGNGFDVFQDVRENFKVMKGQICFVGHTHRPVIFLEKDKHRIKTMGTSNCKLNGQRAIIDVGSVGDPRNSSKKSSFVIFEGDTTTFKRFKLNF